MPRREPKDNNLWKWSRKNDQNECKRDGVDMSDERVQRIREKSHWPLSSTRTKHTHINKLVINKTEAKEDDDKSDGAELMNKKELKMREGRKRESIRDKQSTK